jgi:hypothetical protein
MFLGGIGLIAGGVYMAQSFPPAQVFVLLGQGLIVISVIGAVFRYGK